HMATVAVRHSMEQDGSLRTSGRDQAGIGNAVGVVQRSDIEEPRLLSSSREFELHLRVAAAGLDVALRAVGVQVAAARAVQLLLRVIWVHKPRVFVRSYREQRREPNLALAGIVG